MMLLSVATLVLFSAQINPSQLVCSSPDGSWSRHTFNLPGPSTDYQEMNNGLATASVYAAGTFLVGSSVVIDETDGLDSTISASAANVAGEIWTTGHEGTITEALTLRVSGSATFSAGGSGVGLSAAAFVSVTTGFSSSVGSSEEVELTLSIETSTDGSWTTWLSSLLEPYGITVPNSFTVGWGHHTAPAQASQVLALGYDEFYEWEANTSGLLSTRANGNSTAYVDARSQASSSITGAITLAGGSSGQQ